MARTWTKHEFDADVFEYINDVWRSEYRCPTYREILANTGVASTSTIPRILTRLANRGVLLLSYTEEGGIRSFIPKAIVTVIDADTFACKFPYTQKGE